jgi:hypothetical protein
MNAKKEIERHRLPCGPMSVAVEGVCRRRLRDHFDSLLDKLTQETHPEGRDPEDEDLEDEHEMQEEAKKKREEVERQLENEERSMESDMDSLMDEDETPEEQKDRLIEEGKMKLDVKKVLSKYEEKIMPKPKEKPKAKPKAKTSDHSEPEEEEETPMGNSKMLQDPTGKIKKR